MLRFIVRRYFLSALCRVFHFSKAVPVGPLPLKLRVCQKYLFSTSYQNYSFNFGSDFALKIQNLKRGIFVLAQSENPSDRWGECARASAKCDPTVLATRHKMKEGQDSENTNKFPSDNLNLIISTHWWCVLNRSAISINKTGSKGKILDWVQPWTFDVHEGINWRRKSRFLMGLTLVNKEGTERVELTDLGGRSRCERGHQIGWKNTLQGWGGWRVTTVPNSIPSQEKEIWEALHENSWLTFATFQNDIALFLCHRDFRAASKIGSSRIQLSLCVLYLCICIYSFQI